MELIPSFLLIKNIDDIFIHANDIIFNIERYHDFIYKFTINTNKNCNDIEPKEIISGSKAIVTFLQLLKIAQKKSFDNKIKGCGPFLKLVNNFVPNDVDIVFLDSKESNRTKYNNIDIIHKKVDNISDHIDDIDLDCCKISMSIDENVFWLSLGCLYTMLTSNCFIPDYLESPDKFRSIYNKINNISIKKNFDIFYQSKNNGIDKCTTTYIKINERIKKYKERGYTFQFIETNKPLSCMYNNVDMVRFY